MATKADVDAKVEAMVKALRYDRELTNRQLKERFKTSAATIRRARDIAGVEPPEPDKFSARLKTIKTPDRALYDGKPRMWFQRGTKS